MAPLRSMIGNRIFKESQGIMPNLIREILEKLGEFYFPKSLVTLVTENKIFSLITG